jgi:hypothetical protein
MDVESVVGQLMVLQRTLGPYSWHVWIHYFREFAVVIKLKILRHGDYTNLSG